VQALNVPPEEDVSDLAVVTEASRPDFQVRNHLQSGR